MFVQVLQGRTSDAAALSAAMDRWVRDLAPGAIGWLGSTGGVTDDGRVVVLARFESAEAAGQNSRRPEQDRWWAETAALFDGEVTFSDSEDVIVEATGDLDRAGFVQVMQGRTSDPERARQLTTQDPEAWASFRPDLLGSVTVNSEGGAWTMANYFTSEAEAREGERKEAPPELMEAMTELDKISVGEIEYFDLRTPMILSAR
jgi:hypothetical protein